MTGFEFEDFIKYLFEARQFTDVRKTPRNDQGADLVCLAVAGEKVVVQIKRWRGIVTNRGVQEVIAAMSFYKAQLAFVVTNSRFTRSAWQLAEADGRVTLVDGRKLSAWLRESFPAGMDDKTTTALAAPSAVPVVPVYPNPPRHLSARRAYKSRCRGWRSRPQPRPLVIKEEPMSAAALCGWVVVLALIVAGILALNEHDKQARRDRLDQMYKAIRGSK
jgi:hypothetical protein